MAAQTKIGIFGAGGRMGRMLIAQVCSGDYPCVLGAAVERKGSPAVGQEAGPLKITDDVEAAMMACDVLIDFTTAAAAAANARLAAKHKKPMVIGTTGLSVEEEGEIVALSKIAPVLHAGNMSLGVTLLAALVEKAAAALSAPGFDIEVFEAHHRHKIDAPSGTALLLGRAAAEGRGVNLDDVMVPARHGHTGERKEGDIGFSVFRGGDVVGDHTVTFAGAGERIELTHRASDRAIFAQGAVRAAVWLHGKAPGRYAIRDVLGLK